MIFSGVGVGGDLAKIGRDFHCTEIIKNMKNIVNLGKFARKRKVIKNRVISLQKIVKIVLNKTISKASTTRLSKLSNLILSNKQIVQAATDYIKILQVCFKMYIL